MKLELVKSQKGTWKLISRSNMKNPALRQIAKLLSQANKFDECKIGVYNVTGGWFENKVSVYSYIANKTERMNRKQYTSFLDGKKHVKQSLMKQWKPAKIEDIVGS